MHKFQNQLWRGDTDLQAYTHTCLQKIELGLYQLPTYKPQWVGKKGFFQKLYGTLGDHIA